MKKLNGCQIAGAAVWNETWFFVHIAIAPLPTKRMGDEELTGPNLGALIFRPPPLPYGPDPRADRRKKPIAAATWFWADRGLDTGDICKQEIAQTDTAFDRGSSAGRR